MSSFTETLGDLGAWDLELSEETPDDVMAQVDYLGHLVVVDGRVDVAATGDNLLAAARYVGVCRAWAKPGTFTREGSGLLTWISDEDGKGWRIEATPITLSSATLAQAVAALLPPTVTVGTVFPQANPATRFTGSFVFQSRLDALTTALAPFGAELRVNGDFTVDVGTPDQLYDTVLPLTSKPSPMIVRKGAGSDIDLAAVGGKVQTEGTGWDYSTRVVVVGETIGTGDQPDTTFTLAAADAPSVPYKDPQGNPVKFTRFISASSETSASAPATAALNLNRFARLTTAIKVTADDFDIAGGFGVGDATYVYDPDEGIVDTSVQVLFRGQPINPQTIRVTSMTSPIVEGMTVAWRTNSGVWLDLTGWVVWESAGSREVTVGDLSKTANRPSDPIQDRIDAARGKPDSTRVPKAPTGLALSTASSPNASGWDAAVITATWLPVTQYTDDTTVALSHYEVQYRPQFRAPQWTASMVDDASPADLLVTAALGYDVQVRAVSTGGVASAWSSTVSIVSAADSTGPATPSDPVVTQYLGLLRIYWNGLNSVGGPMPADFNRVDVHVGTSSGFTPSAATLVSSLSAPGYAHAQAPYGSTRFVRFIAYDHNGNPSAASATVSGATVQAADGDIAALSVGKLTAGTISADVVMAGRFATALTGARREVNPVGFQAFDASNNLLVNLDGVNNLLTGIFQTALAGRRIVIGAAGAVGELQFLAPDGTKAYLHAYTESTGIEAMQMGIPIPGETNGFWNKIHFNTDEWTNLQSQNIDMSYLFDGFFTVRQRSARSGGTSISRLQIDNGNIIFRDPGNVGRYQITTGNNFWHDHGSAFRVWERDTGTGATSSRLHVSDTDVWFEWPGTSARALIRPSNRVDTSTRLQLVHPNNFAATFLYRATSSGSSGRVEVMDALESGYVDFWAGTYSNASSIAGKTAVNPLDGSARDKLRTVKPKTFRRKGQRSADGQSAPDAAPELGLIAEEVPEEIRTYKPDGTLFGINMGAQMALTLAYVQELDDLLESATKRIGQLEGRAA